MYRSIALLALALLGACSQGPASAAQTATLDVKLIPEQLGSGTTIDFGVRIAGTSGHVPSPLTSLDFQYPTNLGIANSGLGLETCAPARLEARGPHGCPADSRMGYGSALVEVPFGPTVVDETATTDVFSAPVRDGHLALLFYADGESPIYAQTVFPAVLATAPAPFGGSLDTIIPVVSSIPEAPDVAVVHLRSTLGPLNLTYYKHIHGRRMPYSPRGIVLPKTCPSGGFPFAADLSFQDGTHAAAAITVACPTTHRDHISARPRHQGSREHRHAGILS